MVLMQAGGSAVEHANPQTPASKQAQFIEVREQAWRGCGELVLCRQQTVLYHLLAAYKHAHLIAHPINPSQLSAGKDAKWYGVNMPLNRVMPDAVHLCDGTILLVNGATQGTAVSCRLGLCSNAFWMGQEMWHQLEIAGHTYQATVQHLDSPHSRAGLGQRRPVFPGPRRLPLRLQHQVRQHRRQLPMCASGQGQPAWLSSGMPRACGAGLLSGCHAPACQVLTASSSSFFFHLVRADEPTIFDPVTGKFSAKGSLSMAMRGRG